MIHLPSEVLQHALAKAGYGVLRSQKPQGAWPVHAEHLPTAPDNAICVYTTAGIKDGRRMGGVTDRHQGWQIRIRAVDLRTALVKAAEIEAWLDTVLRLPVTVADRDYTIQAVTQTTGVTPLGQEPTGQRRDEVVLNGLISFSEVVTVPVPLTVGFQAAAIDVTYIFANVDLIPIELSTPADTTVEITGDVVLVGGTAVDGVDYNSFMPEAITFPVGSSHGDTQDAEIGGPYPSVVGKTLDIELQNIVGASGGIVAATLTFV